MRGGMLGSAQRVAKKAGGLLDDVADDFQARMAALRERNAAKAAEQAGAAAPAPMPQPTYLLEEAGPGPADAVSLRGYHYGNQPNLSVLSGRMYGSGAPGREGERLKMADPRLRQRVYFYGEQGGMIPRAEPVVMGPHLYTSDLSGLYLPGKSDPAVLRAARSEGQFDANAFERSLLDYGYGGYFNPEYNQAVLLGRDAPVRYLGTRDALKDRIKR